MGVVGTGIWNVILDEGFRWHIGGREDWSVRGEVGYALCESV